MTPEGTIQNSDLELERYLDGLRSEPAHPRFAVEEFDRGLMILDISYSSNGLVYDGNWSCRRDRKKISSRGSSVDPEGKQNVRYPAIFKMSSGSFLAISIGVERTSSWSCRK
jgi:hypothetical protein